MSLCVLIAVVKEKPHLDPDIYIMLQISSIVIFKKTLILQAFAKFDRKELMYEHHKQLTLFDL
jgi:hypothetical protein